MSNRECSEKGHSLSQMAVVSTHQGLHIQAQCALSGLLRNPERAIASSSRRLGQGFLASEALIQTNGGLWLSLGDSNSKFKVRRGKGGAGEGGWLGVVCVGCSLWSSHPDSSCYHYVPPMWPHLT